MTTLPPNYLRLSSKWLETNPLPEDAYGLKNIMPSGGWFESLLRGQMLPQRAVEEYTYATARTDLPREAYADSEPGAEVASERAEAPAVSAFAFPYDDPELYKAASFVYEWFAKRGSENWEFANLASRKLVSWFRERAQENTATIATLRTQLEAKEAECQRIKKEAHESNSEVAAFLDWLRNQQSWEGFWADGFLGEKPVSQAKQNLQAIRKFLEDSGHGLRFLAERDKLRAEVERLTKAAIPLCVGKPLIQILAKEGQWASEDGQGIVAADCLFRKDPYETITSLTAEVERLIIACEKEFASVQELNDQNTRLTAELDAVRKEIEAWRNLTKSLKETIADTEGAMVENAEARDAAQARCGALERLIGDLVTRKVDAGGVLWSSSNIAGLNPALSARLEALLTPSQQPDKEPAPPIAPEGKATEGEG